MPIVHVFFKSEVTLNNEVSLNYEIIEENTDEYKFSNYSLTNPFSMYSFIFEMPRLLTRNIGKHAAGVVIALSKVTKFSPTYCEEGSKQLVTQFDKKDIEDEEFRDGY